MDLGQRREPDCKDPSEEEATVLVKLCNHAPAPERPPEKGLMEMVPGVEPTEGMELCLEVLEWGLGKDKKEVDKSHHHEAA